MFSIKGSKYNTKEGAVANSEINTKWKT